MTGNKLAQPFGRESHRLSPLRGENNARHHYRFPISVVKARDVYWKESGCHFPLALSPENDKPETQTNECSADVMIGLKKRFRRWGTAVLVAIYALGILGPAVAFAHANADSVIHVLSESHGGFLTLHFHHHGGSDHDQSKKPGAGHAHQCCGVTSISALEPGAEVSLIPLTLESAVAWPSEPGVSGRKLDRLDRPPRFSHPL